MIEHRWTTADYQRTCTHTPSSPGWPCPFCGALELRPTRADMPAIVSPSGPDREIEPGGAVEAERRQDQPEPWNSAAPTMPEQGSLL